MSFRLKSWTRIGASVTSHIPWFILQSYISEFAIYTSKPQQCEIIQIRSTVTNPTMEPIVSFCHLCCLSIQRINRKLSTNNIQTKNCKQLRPKVVFKEDKKRFMYFTTCFCHHNCNWQLGWHGSSKSNESSAIFCV